MADPGVPADVPAEELRELYEQRARLQYAEPAPLPDPLLDRKFERTMELVAEAAPFDSLLDAGCGDGRFLVAAAQVAPSARLAGIDLSTRILETAAAAAAAAGVEVELAAASLESLPFASGRFDVVLSSQTLEHVRNPDAALRELARVLSPGGRLILTTLNRRMLVSRALNLPRELAIRALSLRRRSVSWPEWTFVADDLVARCHAAGLDVVAAETFRFHLQPPLDLVALRRLLNALDRRLPPHGFGDILAVVARRPR